MRVPTPMFFVVLLALCVSCLPRIVTCQGLKCTTGKISEDFRKCVNKFFDEITKNPPRNCSASYQDMISCIDRGKDTCLEHQASDTQLVREAERLKATERDYCSHGMLQQQSRQQIDGCRKKFYKKAAKCEKKFYNMFDKRLADSVDLCRLYSKAKRCTKKYLVKYCSPNAMVQQKIEHFDDPYNPYCHERRDPQGETSLDKKFGRCTSRSYQKLIRNCTANFVDTLKKNRGRKCKSTFRAKYQSCEKETLLYCMYGRYGSADNLNAKVEASLTRRQDYDRERLCSRVDVIIPPVASGQCKARYKANIEACDDKVSETFKANRADPSLCREYAEAKLCAKRVTKAMCSLNADIKAFVEFFYDKFNPFCPGHVDPIARRKRVT